MNTQMDFSAIKQEYYIKQSMHGLEGRSLSPELMQNIFQSLSNLKLDSPSIIGSSDSGMGSMKNARWTQKDFKLMHQDVRAFLKKEMAKNKDEKATDDRKASRIGFAQKRASWCDAIDSGNEVEAEQRLKHFASFKTNSNKVVESLLRLCDSIADHMKLRDLIECEVSYMSNVNFTVVDKASAIAKWDPTKSFADKVNDIIHALFIELNVDHLQQVFNVLEVFCIEQEIPMDNLKISFDSFVQLVNAFRSNAIKHVECSSDENSIELSETALSLSELIDKISTRLWILINLVEVR